jgi:hexosaminidase
LWTETLTNIHDVQYMIFPRLPGIAEIGWTPAESRKWEEYRIRLGKQGERFEALGINYYPSKLVPWTGAKK